MFMSGQNIFKMLLKRPVIATVLGNMFNKLCVQARASCVSDRLTEKIFSSICLVVSIFWEVVNLLTYTSKCPCSRRKTWLKMLS